MIKSLLLFTAMAALVPGADFSGTWQLDVAASDFGKANPPQSQRVVVRQSGDQFEVSSTLTDHRGAQNSQYRLDASGKEVRNELRGTETFSTASWRGESLHVRTRASVQGTEIKSTDEWHLSDNGRKLTIYRSANMPQSNVEQKFVYEKNLARP